MTSPSTYADWAKAFSPGSTFEGNWTQGSTMLFYDPQQGGTIAVLEVSQPPRHLKARHIGMVDKNRKENSENEAAKKWIGTTEEYRFHEKDGITTLDIVMTTHPDFQKMFDHSWPPALQALKKLSEQGSR